MFYRGGDDVVAPAFGGIGNALHSCVVALGPSAGKDNLMRFGTDEMSSPFAYRIDSPARFPAEFMSARRISVNAAEIGQHLSDHPGISRSGRCIVEVYV